MSNQTAAHNETGALPSAATQHNRGNAQLISYEVAALEAIAETYPVEMREDFLWLAGYIRNACARNLDVVEQKLKRLGIETTSSTISKVLRGRWQKDARNERLESPVIKLRSFTAMDEKLREESKLEDMAGKVAFVETPTWKMIESYIDIRRAPQRICKFGFITGPTGSQKTECFKQYRVRNNHGACVWLEAPERPLFGQFIRDLGSAYGCSEYISGTQRLIRIRECVNDRRTIIVDNIQRLYRERDHGDQVVFNFLQKLQDETGCTVILSATPAFNAKFTSGMAQGYFAQFVGRCGGKREFLRLPDQPESDDLLEIGKAFGLQSAEKHLKLLEGLAREGYGVRPVFQTLQSAKQIAEMDGQKLTIEHVKQALGEE
jgi:DNA transposition AAA+ family ATPase